MSGDLLTLPIPEPGEVERPRVNGRYGGKRHRAAIQRRRPKWDDKSR